MNQGAAKVITKLYINAPTMLTLIEEHVELITVLKDLIKYEDIRDLQIKLTANRAKMKAVIAEIRNG